MKGKRILLLTAIGLTFFEALLSMPVKAQTQPSARCLSESESCNYLKYPQFNQQLDFRTSPQIDQRRLNVIENQCSTSNSASCNNLNPKVETRQDNPTIQQLRELQIRTLESR